MIQVWEFVACVFVLIDSLVWKEWFLARKSGCKENYIVSVNSGIAFPIWKILAETINYWIFFNGDRSVFLNDSQNIWYTFLDKCNEILRQMCDFNLPLQFVLYKYECWMSVHVVMFSLINWVGKIENIIQLGTVLGCLVHPSVGVWGEGVAGVCSLSPRLSWGSATRIVCLQVLLSHTSSPFNSIIIKITIETETNDIFAGLAMDKMGRVVELIQNDNIEACAAISFHVEEKIFIMQLSWKECSIQFFRVIVRIFSHYLTILWERSKWLRETTVMKKNILLLRRIPRYIIMLWIHRWIIWHLFSVAGLSLFDNFSYCNPKVYCDILQAIRDTILSM